MPRLFFCSLFAFLTAFFTAPILSAAEELCPKSPPPDWVVAFPHPAPVKEPPLDQIRDGSWLLLVDEQRHAGKELFYGRYIRKFVSSTGVQEYSRISLRFDPLYEKIALHTLRIHRNGEILDRLAGQVIQVLQREEQMEQHLHDGRQTAVLVLDDIRVGDVLEYAFSLQGANPIFAGRYSEVISTRFNVPLFQLRERLLWPRERTLRQLHHETKVESAEIRTRDLIDYRWSANDLSSLLFESGSPSWHLSGGWIQLSDYPSWSAVVEWALPQYAVSPELPPALHPVVERLRARPEGEAQILGALEYAQDELRYLALALGSHSHQPYPIATVLQRGFGDCKDKTRLLCSILSKLGYTAHPALVSTQLRQSIDQWLPTPMAFNHVVVHLEWKGRTYWLDPTASLQRGELATRFFPAYGKALLIKAGTTDLSDVTPSGFDANLIHIREHYKITSFQQPVTLNVESLYQGRDADAIRTFLAETNQEQIGKLYSNYYARLFPSIEAKETPSFHDEPALNRIKGQEAYTIKTLWQARTGNDTHLFAEFYPSNLAEYLATPDTSLRVTPLSVSYPRRLRQTLTITLPDDSKFTPRHTRVEDPAFLFEFDISQNARALTLDYSYTTRRDHVPVDQVPAYLAHLKEARDTLSYVIHIPKEQNGGVSPKPVPDDFNWLLLAVAFLSLIGSMVGAIFLYRWRPSWPPHLPHPRLKGLGGWLILVGIQVLGQPIWQGWNLHYIWPQVQLSAWNALTVPGGAQYHSLWAPALLYSLVFGIVFLIFDFVLIVFYFQKRRTFPLLMIVHIGIILVGSVFDHSILSTIAKALPEIGAGDTQKDLIRAATRAAIWIPYFLVSKRVRTTFTR